MRRREFIGYLGVFGAAAGSTLFGRGSIAQPARKRPLIAWAGAAPPGVKLPQFIVDLAFGNFVKGLSEFGYEQGRNIDIIRRMDIFRDRIPSIEEMVALLKPDIIAVPATLEAVAARNATSTIPIVCPALADAVHLGLIASEARPGGNVTGIEPYIAGLPTKQIELAREIVPKARRVGLLTNMNDPKGPPQVGDLRAACGALSLSVVEADASTAQDIPNALAALANEGVEVTVVLQTSLLLNMSEQIGAIALEKRQPTVFGYREHVVHGGLVSYGVDLRWCYRRAGYFVDKILRGAHPGDLPIEFPSKLWLAVNLKTAKALDVAVPPGLLARTDEVIE
ncbi:ABC transporter substrate-binding protein [Bradyrhizobium japonicum]|jgi:putative ABC transport system substrate-binding protein|uniref:ABC transporter substrate-binding protein n=1 Tax=Bradyrhizobium japonicum TaxID=375 RepID=UPI0004AC7C5D|nr:ABC transporter substrate-binding protein [Bradyrhizobium japonicum]MCP1767623.1 putative ABC transport system substrate-binding protein [Bradyrhizobium japonicum]MCP1789765.1 putative ABC transport system substrate-binding protein [Bradyrhizobium japonicum]MCP1802261.1 putative ABC transport system substrate-binding protein [Bradyrhizobium japonicum]MCP1820571.1 putative ABC transport system substrate-binding protein [Bradyrhizobium japonicum]MCP1867921.1 putative ABC transport system subs